MRPRGAQTEKEGVYLMELKHDAALGYLPEERPPVGKLILYALQQVIVMFPATVTVALITGFQVSTTSSPAAWRRCSSSSSPAGRSPSITALASPI